MEASENISRRRFIKQSGAALALLTAPANMNVLIDEKEHMNNKNTYDVIIIGGSYSGLAAGMALGRALKTVLIIDNGQPSNKRTPYSHNFITQDGNTPKEIAALARQQVEKYRTVEFVNDTAIRGLKVQNAFEIKTESGKTFKAKKLVFATGIIDLMPDIEGFSECWGISALHCPYCHGYEVKDHVTGILGNGPSAYEFTMLISNWTKDLTLYTNGPSNLSDEQKQKLKKHNINLIETEVLKLEHTNGHLNRIFLKNGTDAPINALYSKRPFKQHCELPEKLGCETNDEGYIRTNPFQKTTIDGIYACGDNVTRMRTIANVVAMGTTAGMMVNKELVEESF